MGYRDVLMFAVVFCAIPFMLKHAWVAMLAWVWVGLMNPHRLAYGLAHDFPFAALIGVVLVLALIFSKEERQFKPTPAVITLCIFLLWMGFTSLFAYLGTRAFEYYWMTLKVMGVTLLGLVVINNKKHLDWLVWTIVVSLGFYALKGGLFTVLSGGSHRVWGPESSMVEDNNSLAVAACMTVPFLLYLYEQSSRKMVRVAIVVAGLLMCIAILGSQSRGAFVAIAAMAGFLWLKSRSKVALGVMVVALSPLLLMFMPDTWHERMSTIRTYDVDTSAQGRFHSCSTATNVANDNITGGGFHIVGSEEIQQRYAPNRDFRLAPHSIYFQVLGEHGYIGLGLFLAIWVFTWLGASGVIRASKANPELRWAGTLAAVTQVSLVAFLVGGAFLNLAYWDMPYYEVLIVAVLQYVVKQSQVVKQPQPSNVAQSASAGLAGKPS